MIVARLQAVSKHFGQQSVLENASLDVHDRGCVGIVGRNGSGKTTIFDLLDGTLEPDTGEVWVRSASRVVRMEQQADFGDAKTVADAARAVFRDLDELAAEIESIREQLATDAVPEGSEIERSLLERMDTLDEVFRRRGGYEIDFRVQAVLSGLGFAEVDLAKAVDVLSGGEKNRLALARVLLSAPDVMLLDEPTNHLDIAAVEWLEGYLRSWDGAVLLVSHDRVLLKRVATATVEISRRRLTYYPVPYEQAIQMRDQQHATEKKAFQLQHREIARQEDFIKRNIAGQKTKQAQSRRKMLEKVDRLERPEDDHSASRIRLEAATPGGRDVLMIDRLSGGVAGKTLFEHIDLHVRRGDRIGIVGPNGSGKTTFLHTLAGIREPFSGAYTYGAGILPALLDQELGSLNREESILGELHALRPTAPQTEMRNYLALFLFQGDDVFKRVGDLSGGEQCRVALAKLFMDGPNLLFLDEPTNHLDIDGRVALENALREYDGTAIAVSHDRAFLNAFAQTIWYVAHGTVREFGGNFDEFRTKMGDAFSAPSSLLGSPNGDADSASSADVLTYDERRELKRERDRTKRERKRRTARAEELEHLIADLDVRMEKLVAKMTAAVIAPDALRELTIEHAGLDGEKTAAYAEWEELVEALEADLDDASH